MFRPGLALTVLAALALSACDAPMTFKTQLSGANQVPPNSSPATGTATATVYPSTRAMTYEVTYKDLTGPATAAHFHGPAAPGANAGVLIPMKVTPSPIKGGAMVTDDQLAALQAGKVYVNVHTKAYPDGEIRGQLQRTQ